MNKRISLLCLFMLTTFSGIFAKPIDSYQELTSATLAGNHFVILLDLKQCTGNTEMPIGYFIPQSMLLTPASEKNTECLATSHLQFTDYMGAPIYEYIKYRFFTDNSVEIRVARYDPQHFTLLSPPKIFYCSFGNGIKITSD